MGPCFLPEPQASLKFFVLVRFRYGQRRKEWTGAGARIRNLIRVLRLIFLARFKEEPTGGTNFSVFSAQSVKAREVTSRKAGEWESLAVEIDGVGMPFLRSCQSIAAAMLFSLE